jgi:hypothetical protein
MSAMMTLTATYATTTSADRLLGSAVGQPTWDSGARTLAVTSDELHLVRNWTSVLALRCMGGPPGRGGADSVTALLPTLLVGRGPDHAEPRG